MIRSFLLIFDVCFGFVFIRGIMLHLLVAQHYTVTSPKSPVVLMDNYSSVFDVGKHTEKS